MRSEPTNGKITLQVALAVAAEARTPAARSRVASVLAACPSFGRGVIDRVAAAGHRETLANARGLLTCLASNASVTRAVRGIGDDGRDGGETDARLRGGRGRSAVFRSVRGRRDAILNVVGEPGRQAARVQLVEYDQLQQIVELGYALVDSV